MDEEGAKIEVGMPFSSPFRFNLDPVSRSFCWLLDITLDFSGASTYKFCTRSGSGLGATRLIFTGCGLPDKDAL